jgi:hypothetical protein
MHMIPTTTHGPIGEMKAEPIERLTVPSRRKAPSIPTAEPIRDIRPNTATAVAFTA